MSSGTGSGGTKPKEGFESYGSTKRAAAAAAAAAASACSLENDDVSSSLPPRPKRQARGNDDNEEEEDSGNHHAANRTSWDDDYQGFPFSSSCLSAKKKVMEIDRITSASKLTPEAFFERYVAPRRPCVLGKDSSSLLFLATTNSNKSNKLLTLQDLSSLDNGAADAIICQVERRPNAQTPFGQNRTRQYMQEMSLTKVIECLQDANTRHLYYLSTQQQEQEDAFGNNSSNDHNEATSTTLLPPPPAADFSPLTKKLVQAGLIQDHVPLAGNLILQSCQLWMGGSSIGSGIGSSSGLHHDFHDNFYLLHAGRKRFTLYPPNAPIPVFGQRQRIHGNGLISYHSNPTRADGVPLSLLLLLSHPRTASAAAINKNSDKESEEEDGEDDDEEEEVVLGKGFDYQSDTDDEDSGDAAAAHLDDDAAVVDDYDAMFGNDGDDDDESDEQPNGTDDRNESQKKAAVVKSDMDSENGAKTKATSHETTRPDSFSPVNLSLDPKELHEAFPIMKTLQPPIIVEIQAGECLYLPASWFHCVESFAADDDDHDDTSGNDMNNSGGVHMAINYWYHPPDRLDHFPDPYKHDYWKRKTQRNMS